MIKIVLIILGMNVPYTYGHGTKHLSDSQLAAAMEEKLRAGFLGNSWSELLNHSIFNKISSKEPKQLTIAQQIEEENRIFLFETKLQTALNNIYKTHYNHRGKNQHTSIPLLLFDADTSILNNVPTRQQIRKHRSARLTWSTFANSFSSPIEWIRMYYGEQLYQ